MQYVIHVLLVSLTLHHQHTKAIKKNIQTSGHPCCNHRPSNDASQCHPPPAAPPPQMIKKQSNSHSPHTPSVNNDSSSWIQIQTSRSQDCLPPPTTQTTQAKQLAPLLLPLPHHHFSTAPSTQHPGQHIKKNTFSSLLQSPAMHSPSTSTQHHPKMIMQSNSHHSHHTAHSTQAHLSMMTIPAST